MFAKNEGRIDRVLRSTVGLILGFLGFGGVIGGTAGLVVGLLGLVPLVTGLMGFCPLYAVLGWSTCPRGAR